MGRRAERQDPQTPGEWQEAAGAAHALLLLDAARQYGQVTGGPDVDQTRCVELLEQAKRLGIAPCAEFTVP